MNEINDLIKAMKESVLPSDIVEIKKLKDVKIRKINNNFIYPRQNIILVKTGDGKERLLDLDINADLTSITNFDYLTTPETQEEIIFQNDIYFK